MDSHEEKVYQAVRQVCNNHSALTFVQNITKDRIKIASLFQSQERDAKQKMREKAKELQRQKMEAAKMGAGRGMGGRSAYSSSASSFSNNSSTGPVLVQEQSTADPVRSSYS